MCAVRKSAPGAKTAESVYIFSVKALPINRRGFFYEAGNIIVRGKLYGCGIT
jgi:hypothetical protein